MIGMVREIRDLGRFVLPVDLRHLLKIKPGDELEFFLNGNQIVLRKCELGCLFCGKSKGIIVFKDRRVCRKCISMAVEVGKQKGDGNAVSNRGARIRRF